jgi:hypothetical protein
MIGPGIPVSIKKLAGTLLSMPGVTQQPFPSSHSYGKATDPKTYDPKI